MTKMTINKISSPNSTFTTSLTSTQQVESGEPRRNFEKLFRNNFEISIGSPKFKKQDSRRKLSSQPISESLLLDSKKDQLENEFPDKKSPSLREACPITLRATFPQNQALNPVSTALASEFNRLFPVFLFLLLIIRETLVFAYLLASDLDVNFKIIIFRKYQKCNFHINQHLDLKTRSVSG